MPCITPFFAPWLRIKSLAYNEQLIFSPLLRLVFIGFLLVGLLACSEPEVQLTIDEEKWVSILVDAHFIESAAQNIRVGGRDSMAQKYYAQLYEIHDIDETLFLENIGIMEKDPKLISKIYSKVMEELSKREAATK